MIENKPRLEARNDKFEKRFEFLRDQPSAGVDKADWQGVWFVLAKHEAQPALANRLRHLIA